jgi:hypothetical protein
MQESVEEERCSSWKDNPGELSLSLFQVKAKLFPIIRSTIVIAVERCQQWHFENNGIAPVTSTLNRLVYSYYYNRRQ